MLKKLLLTAALISSTFGSDATQITYEINPHPQNVMDTVKAETHEDISLTLDKIQSILKDPHISTEESQQAILELDRLSIIRYFRITDIGSDGFKPSIIFEFIHPEIEVFAKTNAKEILAPLVEKLSGSENLFGLFSLFIITGFASDLTPELLEIYMSDSALSFISAGLASSDSSINYPTLLLVCQLINSITDPIHIAKLQELAIKYLTSFLEDPGGLFMQLLKLASLDSDHTSKFIYELHQGLLKFIYKPAASTLEDGSITTRVDIQELSTLEEGAPKKKALTVLIFLKNYRDKFLNDILDLLGLSQFSLNNEVMETPFFKNSQLIQVGNPIHRNHEIYITTGRIVLGESLKTLLMEQDIYDFLRKSGLGDLILDASVASAD